MAERIRAAFSETSQVVAGLAVGATVSSGVAGAAGTGISRDALLELADQALYRAKADGRNRVAVSAAPPPADSGRQALRVA